MILLIDSPDNILRRQLEQLPGSCNRVRWQRANLARHLSGLDDGMTRWNDRVDKTSLARVFCVHGSPHHQHGERALMTHHSWQQQAGSALRDEAVLNKGRLKRCRRTRTDEVAMKHNGGADTDGDAVDCRNDGLPVVHKR